MKKLLVILFLLSGLALGQSLSGVNGDCTVGGAQALTSGLPSTATQQIGTTNVIAGAGVQGSYPSCLVSVYATGTTSKAAIWADNSGTPAPLANPFTANGDGSFTFFSGSGCYDIVMSSGIAPLMPYPRTLTDLCIGTSGGGTGVGGTGTPPSMAVWLGPTQLGNSTMTDDLVNPPTSPNGLNFVQGAAFYTGPNCNPTGTTQNHLAQISGNCITLNTQTTNILGIAGPGSGNVGNVSVATNLTYSCVFDNQTTPGDWAVAGTPADECDDAGATRPTTGVQILGHIANANSGAGTMALVIQNTGDTVQAGASNGNLLSCATIGAMFFAPAPVPGTTGQCDPLALTDGAGNETATSLTLTGTGAGFLALVQGTAPTLTDANAAYFAAPAAVATSFLTLVPAAPPVASGCLQGDTSGGIVTLSYTGGACGSGSGSVSSFSAGTLSPLFTTSVATPTTTPALTFSLSNAAGGTVFGNRTGSSAAPTYTSTPVLGVPTSTIGTLGLAGNTSGTATITPQAAAGTPTLTLPNTSGTFAVTATSPLVLNATTGALTCPSCGTGSGSVSSVGLTVNSTSPSGIFTVTGSPVTTTGTLNFNLAGTSGGIPYFSSSTVMSSSGLLTNHAITLGAGSAAAPFSLGSLGTTTTVLHGNASGDPSFAAVVGADMTNNTVTATQLASQYSILRCYPGLGDGLNAITAGTYLQTNCYNNSGVTWTITRIGCFTDNSGTSTLNATNGAGTGLLTGAVTCTTAAGGAAGSQSGTTTISNTDVIKFTFVADGTSKQTGWFVTLTQ